MKSITEIEYNNPEVCIKNNGSTFACICPKCITEGFERMDKFFNSLTPTSIGEVEGGKIK